MDIIEVTLSCESAVDEAVSVLFQSKVVNFFGGESTFAFLCRKSFSDFFSDQESKEYCRILKM